MLSLAKGDIARAEAAFAEAVRVKPDSIAGAHLPRLLPLDAEAHRGSGTGPQGRPRDRSFNELVNRALAAFYMQSERRAEAEPFLKTVAEKGNASTKLALADYYTGMKRIEDAKTTLKSVEADKKIGGQASVRLALIAFAEKRSAEAYAIVDGLIAKGTETASAQLMKGRFLLADQKLEPAIDALRAAVKADPKLASAHFMLGNALSANNDLAGAAEAYRATLEFVPGAANVQLQRARVSLQRGDSATSFTAATTALEKQPDNPSPAW